MPDPASLLYTTCIDGSQEHQKSQEIYCHTRCLQACLKPKLPLYVLDLLPKVN